MPRSLGNPRQPVPQRVSSLEFGVPYPTFRARHDGGQVIPATQEEIIEFELFENSHTDIFDENPNGGPVQSVTLKIRGVFAIYANYDWGSPPFPDNTQFWIATNDGYDSGSQHSQDHYGQHQHGSEISLEQVSGFPPFTQQPSSPSSIGEVNVYAGNGDTVDHALFYANLEIFYLGGLAVDTEQYP